MSLIQSQKTSWEMRIAYDLLIAQPKNTLLMLISHGLLIAHLPPITLTKYSWVVQLISHGQSSSLKASFDIELGSLDCNMVSEPPLGCWADLPPYYSPRVWLVRHTWGGILKWESIPTLTKYSWIVQLISNGQSSSLKASFEIELGLLDFNKK